MSRAAAAPHSAQSHEDFAALWTFALWILAAIYLLATFSVH